MSVEGIIDRIISDAKAQAGKITGEAAQQARSIEDENRLEAEEYFKRERERLEEQCRREKERAILGRRLAQRKAVLAARQEWMDRAFSTAYQRLVDQPFSEYRSLLLKLIRKVSGSKDEEIIFGQKGEQADLHKIVGELNSDKGARFTMSDAKGDFSWGFILKKGKVEVNLSIESLFKYKRNDLEQKVWELFDGGA